MLTASVIEIEELNFSAKNLENNLSKIGINNIIDNTETKLNISETENSFIGLASKITISESDKADNLSYSLFLIFAYIKRSDIKLALITDGENEQRYA